MKHTTDRLSSPCYRRFVNVKTIKRVEALAKEIGAAPTQTKRVLIGLSFGYSSTALVDVLNDSVQSQLRKRPSPAFDPVVVYVDTNLSSPAVEDSNDSSSSSPPSPSPTTSLLERFQERYPRFRFLRVPLADVLEISSVDWSSLPVAPSTEASLTPAERLRDFLSRLPSTTSRSDVLRLLVRHVLIAYALREDCRALLLGSSTTALAELTLGETAKGRGFSLPWMINDGPVPVVKQPFMARKETKDDDKPTEETVDKDSSEVGDQTAEGLNKLPVYYPNRELFRGELKQYTTLTEPPLTDMLSSATSMTSSSAVVSHKDVSIDEVMARYFTEVEENYPSIVANVVRTTAKLERANCHEEEQCCGLCGMGLDELGDERWKGEIGDVGCGEDQALCYGCSRATRG